MADRDVRAYVLDRVEDGEWAVLEPIGEEGGAALLIPRAWLPDGVREGAVLNVEAPGGGTVRFELDAAATRRRSDELRARRDRLPRGPSGDISL